MNTFQRIIKYAALALAFSIIVSILSLLFGFISSISEIFESSVSTEISTELSTDYIGSQINSLEIDLKEVSLYITKGNSFNVKTNTDKITSEVINSELKIKDKSSKYSKNKIVELTIPENVILNEIDIEVGLGKNNIELLNANNIKLELGAGNMTINNINAYTNFEVDGGSGEINIMNANVSNMEIDMGVGLTTFEGTLKGNNKIEAGIGELRINLKDSIDNYRFDVNKAIGSIKVNNNEISNNTIYGTGVNLLKIDGGIGSIKINTK